MDNSWDTQKALFKRRDAYWEQREHGSDLEDTDTFEIIKTKWASTWENQSSVVCEKNKGADQPVHPRILISAFVIRYLESTVVKLAPYKMPLF